MDVFSAVRDIVCDTVGVPPEEVTPEARIIEDLGADSLDAMQIVMECEERFGITVSDEEAEKLGAIGKVVEFIEERRRAAAETG